MTLCNSVFLLLISLLFCVFKIKYICFLSIHRSMLDKLGFSWEMRSEIRKRLGEQEAAEQQLQSDNELLRRPRTSAGDGSTTTGSGSSSSSSFSTRKGAVGAEAADTVLAKLLQDFKTRSQLAGQSTASRVLPGQLRPAQQQHQLQQKQTDAKRSAESVLDHLDMTDVRKPSSFFFDFTVSISSSFTQKFLLFYVVLLFCELVG